jgi:hypothetical protein
LASLISAIAAAMRRAEFMRQQIGRDLRAEIADEEDRCAGAVNLGREAELAVHLQRGEAEIGAIDIVEHDEEEQQRNDPPEELAHDRARKDLAAARHIALCHHVALLPPIARPCALVAFARVRAASQLIDLRLAC